MEHVVVVDDGHQVQVVDAGDPDGPVVFVHNGMPSSRLIYSPHAVAAERAGLRLLSHDRPGYGGSTPRPGRSVADVASDIRTIAEQLGIRRCAVWGFSAGGPHALACAALLPELVAAAVVLASVAPPDAAGLDYFAGMDPEDLADAQALLEDPDAARSRWEAAREAILRLSSDDCLASVRADTPTAQHDLVDERFADYRIESYHSGLADGAEGWFEDESALLRPWGFSVGDITSPVLLRHGLNDRAVPVEHGHWLAAQIPHCESDFTDDTHLSAFLRAENDYPWLSTQLS